MRVNRAAPSQAPETEVKAEPVVDEYNMNMSIYMLVDVISSETGAI